MTGSQFYSPKLFGLFTFIYHAVKSGILEDDFTGHFSNNRGLDCDQYVRTLVDHYTRGSFAFAVCIIVLSNGE